MSVFNENSITVIAKQVPGQVSFYNFEELKATLSQGLSVYKTTEYTSENLEQAANDLKELKAINKKLTDKKNELEAAYSLPINEVKKQLEELISMVKEPIDILDKMIKENKKAVKQAEIMKYAAEKTAELGEYSDKVLESAAFFNPKWLNVSYKTKDWRADIDKIVQDTSDALVTIQNIGGKNKAALMGFYFDKLSLDGAEQFMKVIAEDSTDVELSAIDDGNAVVGYKVLKITGTERQMLQLMTQLELSDMEVEEIEDGMPKSMEEVTTADFDTFVAFDIEHTGTYGIDNGDADAEIIEIGAVKVVNGQVVDKFDMLANPGRKILPRIARLTHITDDMVANEPAVSEVIAQFKAFVGDSILVGHNIKSCDIPHITRAAKRAGVAFENTYLDTKVLATTLKAKMGWDKITLPELSKFYQVKQEEAHRAWCDAEANAYVYLKMKEE